jgi:hypothetical protein
MQQIQGEKIQRKKACYAIINRAEAFDLLSEKEPLQLQMVSTPLPADKGEKEGQEEGGGERRPPATWKTGGL